MLAGTVLVGTSATRAAYQDMTSFVGGVHKIERWHAFLVPASSGGITIADLAYSADEGAKKIAAREAAERFAKRMAQIAEGDEPRIVRTAKSGRVVAERLNGSMPPRGFSAGSILDRQSLLGSRVAGGEARIRNAFSKVEQSTKDSVALAMSFQLQGPPRFETPKNRKLKVEDKVMLASLKPSVDDTNALGYAPSESSATGRASSMFERVLKDQPEVFIPPISEKDHAWAATPLPEKAYSKAEQKCLANGIYFEARGESSEGQAAVAQVILNRVRNPAYPNTICGVVYQNKNWRNRCQFSFACDGAKDRIRDAGSYSRAKKIADKVTNGEIWLAEVGSATHYHANYVSPRWARAMERVDKIGRHIFYRTYNGGM
ncbi:cell wall hydrolase [Jiella marina]|uniref:cell wall hydrolase n=1 Tax=Jiella sp. LLJ827 TaxID=2917712 RepID=UPI002101122B|nr:cell wall hydrolase [Jiella sp. LLJ827]MCQ0986594.1 cell wall hydrolase [Jiella sp. LLJ827]